VNRGDNISSTDISNSGYRTDEKIKTSTKWFFALGDIFSGGFFNIVNIYYSFFLTNVVGIPLYWAGAVFIIGNILDAVTDPAMGIISDNTRTRFGRRRPYFLIGAPLVLLAFVMMWFPLSSGTEASKIIFYIFAFVLMNTVTTIVQVPFLSMAAELSTDYNERTSITNARMVVSVAATIICAVIPHEIIKYYRDMGDINQGYIVMSIAFGLLFTLPYLVVFFKVKERKQFSLSKKGTLRDMFTPLRMRIFRRFMYIYLGIILSMDVIAMIFVYFMTYNLGRYDELNFVLGALLICQVFCVPLASWYAKKTSKVRAVVLGNICWIAVAAAIFLITRDSPMYFIYMIAGGIGCSMSFSLVGYTAVFGDVTEVGEYHLGYRAEGSFYGIQQFIRKCLAALANGGVLMLLGLSGFVNPVEIIENGVTILVEQPQTPTALFTIKAILGFVSIVLLIPSTIFALRWELSKEKHAKLIAYLDRKRAGIDISRQDEQEVQEICKSLT